MGALLLGGSARSEWQVVSEAVARNPTGERPALVGMRHAFAIGQRKIHRYEQQVLIAELALSKIGGTSLMTSGQILARQLSP